MNNKLAVREDNLVETALQHLLVHASIQGEWMPQRSPGGKGIDGDLLLNIQGTEVLLHAEVKKEIRQYHLDLILNLACEHAPFILIAQSITPNIKLQLKQHKVAYLESAGNIYLNLPGQFLLIEGNKMNKEDKPIPNRAFTKTGLKVLFLLLTNPDAVQWTHREIAEQTDVALGNIPMVFAGLKEGGFILPLDKSKITLQNKKELFERWITGYREILRPALHLGNYQWMDNKRDWKNIDLTDGDVWGGELAADKLTGYLNPQKLTLYLESAKQHLIKDWKLIPNPKGELQLFEKFWLADKGAEDHIAPSLITYADLIITDEPRNLEAAAIIYKNYLQQNLE